MTKPTETPKWAALAENDPITGAPNKKQPSLEFQNSGLKREEPFFRDHLNYQFDLINQWIEYLDTVSSTIVADKTVYVATTGNDTTGTGDILAPFATPHKALDSLIGTPIAPNVTVTIFCAAGTYNFISTPLVFNHPYGERIHILGDTLTGVKPFGFPIADWSSNKVAPTVPARATDEFYNTSGTLGTTQDAATRLTALQSDLTNNKILAESRYATIFKFTDSSGIEVQGNNSLGLLDKILIEGSWGGNEADTVLYYGIDSGESLSGTGTPQNVTGGTAHIGTDVCVIGFQGIGIRARYGGVIGCRDGVAVLGNRSQGFSVSGTSTIIANASMSQGNYSHGYFSSVGGVIRAEGSISSGNIGTGYIAGTGGTLRITGSKALGNGSINVSITVNSTGAMDGIIARGSFTHGIFTAIGSGVDADTCISSDNGGMGIRCDSAVFDGQFATVQNNALQGLYCVQGGAITTTFGNIGLNDGDDVFVTSLGFIDITSSTVPSGGSVIAARNSFIKSPNTAGVTYTPSYGTVVDEAFINS